MIFALHHTSLAEREPNSYTQIIDKVRLVLCIVSTGCDCFHRMKTDWKQLSPCFIAFQDMNTNFNALCCHGNQTTLFSTASPCRLVQTLY